MIKSNSLIRYIAIIMTLYHIIYMINPTIPSLSHRAIHLSFALVMVFLLFPSNKFNKIYISILNLLFIIFSICIGVYVYFNYWGITYRAGSPSTMDLIIAGITILLTLEASRRSLGKPLVITALIFLLYAFYGKYLPGEIAHRGYKLTRILEHTFMGSEGIFGLSIYVTSTFVYMFLLLGSILEETGGSKAFIDLALALTGKYRGGPAKTATVGSAFFGTISGSSFANVVGTGTFTIPLMKSVGYPPEFAGGVEAAASSGGQIMPPVMGAAAFIMAEMTGTPYVKIIIHAALPGILYFLSIFLMVDFRAARMNLKGLSKESIPVLSKVLKKNILVFLPLVSLVYFLVTGYSIMRAALLATAIAFLGSMIKKESRMDVKKTLDAFEKTARTSIKLIIACAIAGVIVGVVTLTGIGAKFANLVVSLSHNYLYLALFLTMVACIVLSMGMPTTPLYIILAVMIAPALVKMGIPVIAAHLFIFYYGCFSSVTPPVALSSYLAASIAHSNPTRTALAGFKLALAAFIMPFYFVLSPELLFYGTNINILKTIKVIVFAIISIFSLAMGIEGHIYTKINILQSIILIIAAIVLVIPNTLINLCCIVLIGAVVCHNLVIRRKTMVMSTNRLDK